MSIQTGAPQAAIVMQSPPTANEVSSHLVPIRGVIYPPVPVSAIAGITGWVARHWYESNTVLRPLSSVRQTVHDWGGTLLEYLIASPDLDRVGLYCSRQHYCRAVSSVTRRVSWRDDSVKHLPVR